jgi:hypothetical protein
MPPASRSSDNRLTAAAGALKITSPCLKAAYPDRGGATARRAQQISHATRACTLSLPIEIIDSFATPNLMKIHKKLQVSLYIRKKMQK